MAVEPAPAADEGTPVFKVWKAYEDVAMHFNDLLIKLRIQALGGVAALAVLASIFSNVRAYSFKGTWTIAAACFAGLVLIWLAIAALDLLYYNRLLVGSVAAIKEIETLSENETHVTHLNLSTRIEEAVKGTSAWPSCGVLAFYLIVFLTLATGLGVTTYSACNYPPPKAEADDGLVPPLPAERPREAPKRPAQSPAP